MHLLETCISGRTILFDTGFRPLDVCLNTRTLFLVEALFTFFLPRDVFGNEIKREVRMGLLHNVYLHTIIPYILYSSRRNSIAMRSHK